MPSKPGSIHKRMIEVLKKHPEGITAGQWRGELGLAPEEQNQLDRRKRDLYKWFDIERSREGSETVYRYRGEHPAPRDSGPVSLKLRAEILQRDRGRCQMCGATIEKDGVRLVVDHKIPQEWGGPSERDNLWTLCEDCNQGKKNYFASQDTALMKKVMPN